MRVLNACDRADSGHTGQDMSQRKLRDLPEDP